LSLTALALWFVCGLGTAILVAATPLSRVGATMAVAAFALGTWWARQPFAPSTATVALAAAVIAVWQVVRPPQRPYATIVGGLLAGIWTAVLAAQGLPLLAAIPVAALLPAASAWLRVRRAAFAPPANLLMGLMSGVEDSIGGCADDSISRIVKSSSVPFLTC